VSSLTVLVLLAVLPALSLAVIWIVVTPSVEMVWRVSRCCRSRETAWLARPEVASEELAVTVTGATYQPFEPFGRSGIQRCIRYGRGAIHCDSHGAAVVVLPAMSVARKPIEWCHPRPH